MSINLDKKKEMVKELEETFNSTEAFFLLDYVNIPVNRAMELRGKLREKACSLKVIKNRLAIRAMGERFPEEMKNDLRGPTAIAYTQDDPVSLAQVLDKFLTDYKILSVKSGLVEGRYIEESKFKRIAKLEPREELLAKLGYLMASPLTRFLRAWKAPMQSFGSMLSQLKSKK